ncbi:hypothetical protein HA402_006512 [Bradysia odoriphaga]|nr:hypothetical protein HA402_006512 [Bradysia odoriphaga]
MKCYLKCVGDARHDPIEIRDDVETFIGRLRATEIKDVMCSRNQVSLKADFDKRNVNVKALGVNNSGINGFALKKDQMYVLQPDDVLEILLGKYFYEIVFETDSAADQRTDKVSVSPTVATVKSADVVWESVGDGKLLIFTPANVRASNKIAAYDLDGTIITTKSEKRFPQDVDDWKIFPYVAPKLSSLHQDDYKIVFFTNQNGISLGKYKVEDYKKKTEAIVTKLGLPIQVFAATGKTIYRKPMLGMWNYLCEHKNQSVKINKNESIFVGDAAGRPANKVLKTKKDHSTADRLFALNIGIKFQTPEEHFLKHSTSTWVRPLFDPKGFVAPKSLLDPPDSRLVSTKLEVILMVGCPGSGKSTFATTHLVSSGYKWINQDTLKTWQNCLKHLENAVTAKQNSVIDNTNPSKETRRRYIEAAKKLKIQCRCFVMDVPFAHSKHNNIYRELTDSTHKTVNDIVMNTFNKHYEQPTVAEGFEEVVKVNFIPKFNSIDEEQLYRMYLVDS